MEARPLRPEELVGNYELPELSVAESRLFTHPSRLGDFYVPKVEEVVLPSFQLEPQRVEVVARRDVTIPDSASLRDKARLAVRDFQAFSGSIVDGPDHVALFEFRYDTDQNPAHVMALMMSILLCRSALSEAAGEPREVWAILSSKPSGLVLRALDQLGIGYLQTECAVRGLIIQNAREIRLSYLQPAIPRLLDFEFDGYIRDTPRRVYFPRRGARSLVNHDEVAAHLERRGFTTILPETLSITEQWSIGRNAEVAAVVHGASWWSFYFARQGILSNGRNLKLLDIFSPAFMLETRYLAASLQARYGAVRGQITPKMLRLLDFRKGRPPSSPLDAPAYLPFEVSTDSVDRALEYLGVD